MLYKSLYVAVSYKAEIMKKNSNKGNFISRRKILSIIGFVLILLIYFLSDFGSRTSSVSSEMFTIATHRLPYSALAGVFSSIATVALICLVVFYRKVGFYVAMAILAIRTIRLTIGITQFHASSFPALFMTFAAIVAVFLIYKQNERMQKVQERHRNELEEFSQSIIGAFASCIDGKDSYTNGHSFRVAKYTRLLAQKLGESEATVENFYNIALLHDIGKIGIPESILNKPGKLTDEEFSVMKSHVKRGYEILKDVKIQGDLAAGAHHHHERFDGRGYPEGLSGYSIPWVARVIAVADTFDAMSSTRPYRKKLPMDFIVEEIKKCSGTQFDPVVAEAFLGLYEDGAFDDLKDS